MEDGIIAIPVVRCKTSRNTYFCVVVLYNETSLYFYMFKLSKIGNCIVLIRVDIWVEEIWQRCTNASGQLMRRRIEKTTVFDEIDPKVNNIT
jgi:hypothetical protein